MFTLYHKISVERMSEFVKHKNLPGSTLPTVNSFNNANGLTKILNKCA